jgi:hypothetical protein
LDDSEWRPQGIDVETPSTARIYDYLLDGKDNFPADRAAGDRLIAAVPHAKALAQANRRFLVRALRLLTESGVQQFIDLGTGIPTSPNVHEVTKSVWPDAKVAYVDHDPIVMSHNRALRATVDGVLAVEGDIRKPTAILEHPDVQALIDFTRPVAVLFIAVLHFIADSEDPAGIIATFGDRLVPGSYLAISTTSSEGFSAVELDQITRSFKGATSALTLRPREQIEGFFDGFELLEPGVVDAFKWRADEPVVPGKMLAGVGKKP